MREVRRTGRGARASLSDGVCIRRCLVVPLCRCLCVSVSFHQNLSFHRLHNHGEEQNIGKRVSRKSGSRGTPLATRQSAASLPFAFRPVISTPFPSYAQEDGVDAEMGDPELESSDRERASGNGSEGGGSSDATVATGDAPELAPIRDSWSEVGHLKVASQPQSARKQSPCLLDLKCFSLRHR